MTISRRTLSILGLGFALVAGAVFLSAGDQDFVLVNKTGYDIDEVYVSPANAKHWGDDVMGKDTLDNGDKVTIQFSHKEKECDWDMKIAYPAADFSFTGHSLGGGLACGAVRRPSTENGCGAAYARSRT